MTNSAADPAPPSSPPPSRHRVLGRGLRVLGHGIREEPGVFAVGIAGSIAFGLLTVGSAFVIRAVLERVVLPAWQRGEVRPAALALAAVAIVGLSLAKVAAVFARRLGAGAMQMRLQASYRHRVTGRYLDLPISWHQRHQTGTLLSNANSDVEAAWFPVAAFPFAVGTMVMLVAAVTGLALIDWAFVLVALAIFPALSLLNMVFARRMAPQVARAQQLRAETSAIAHESFDGALVVKTMGQEAAETARFAAVSDQLREAMIGVGVTRGLFDAVLDALPNLGTLAALGVGAIRLSQGAVDVADVVAVAFLFAVLGFPVRAIGWVLSEMPRSVVGWDRIQRVLAQTTTMEYGTAELCSTAPATLRFDRVSFAYPGGAEVLREVSFEVPAGGTVALVGATGAGKSTVAALTARLVSPDRGGIFIDGVPISGLSAASLAGTVALVPQVPFIFSDTVRANVDLGRERADAESTRRALRLSQAEQFVAELPHGWDTEVGERGATLSGGQRQRVTLARALAGRPRLLVLDDATSAVDPRVEAAMLTALRGREVPTSLLVVAYRRATIALADEVVYLEGGRVRARGSHDWLLAHEPGYADLVTAYERAERAEHPGRAGRAEADGARTRTEVDVVA